MLPASRIIVSQLCTELTAAGNHAMMPERKLPPIKTLHRNAVTASARLQHLVTATFGTHVNPDTAVAGEAAEGWRKETTNSEFAMSKDRPTCFLFIAQLQRRLPLPCPTRRGNVFLYLFTVHTAPSAAWLFLRREKVRDCKLIQLVSFCCLVVSFQITIHASQPSYLFCLETRKGAACPPKREKTYVSRKYGLVSPKIYVEQQVLQSYLLVIIMRFYCITHISTLREDHIKHERKKNRQNRQVSMEFHRTRRATWCSHNLGSLGCA